MSVASRRNQKNLWGKPDIIGRDVWEVNGSVGQAPGPAAGLSDSAGQTSYLAGCEARLEGLMVQTSGTLATGRVGVDVRLNGLAVGSGALYAGGPASLYVKLLKAELNDVAIASGDALTVNASVEQGLSAGFQLRASVSLALLQRSER